MNYSSITRFYIFSILIIIFTGCTRKITEERFEYNFKKAVIKRIGRINYLGSKNNHDYFYFVMSAFGTEKVKIKSNNLIINNRIPYSYRKNRYNDIRKLNIEYKGVEANIKNKAQ